MTDDKQLERFRQAVEEKNERARQKAEAAPPPREEQDVVPEEQPELHEPGRPQDTRDERAKSSRHGHVTADRWNQ
jgi:hypothetical protein